ncbi:hypothetical protein V865_006283 [Kwoniella europaea PYCC6329]|uniref:Uncharacterized protein n=1 Tax=Kwoniella europaea PYCC6329 TaxID=1423913 RepID=A0AAX4KPB1_9TREE
MRVYSIDDLNTTDPFIATTYICSSGPLPYDDRTAEKIPISTPLFRTDTFLMVPCSHEQYYDFDDLWKLVLFENYPAPSKDPEFQHVYSCRPKFPRIDPEAIADRLGQDKSKEFQDVCSHARSIEKELIESVEGKGRLDRPWIQSVGQLTEKSTPDQLIRDTQKGLEEFSKFVNDTAKESFTANGKEYRHFVWSQEELLSRYVWNSTRGQTYDSFDHGMSWLKELNRIRPTEDLVTDMNALEITDKDDGERGENERPKFTVVTIPYLEEGIHPQVDNSAFKGLVGSKGKLLVKYIHSGSGGSFEDWSAMEKFKSRFEKSLRDTQPEQDEQVLSEIGLEEFIRRSKEWEQSIEQYAENIFNQNRSIRPENVWHMSITGSELDKYMPLTAKRLGVVDWAHYRDNVNTFASWYENEYRKVSPDQAQNTSASVISKEEEDEGSDDEFGLDEPTWNAMVALNKFSRDESIFIRDLPQKLSVSKHLFPSTASTGSSEEAKSSQVSVDK